MTEECDAAFRDLKFYLASPPILSRPGPEEDLYMYLVVSDHAMSAVLLRHQDRIQRDLYIPLEKMAPVLVHAMRKLPHYFQAHTVWVLIEYLLQSLLRRSNFFKRIKMGNETQDV